jgi:hypothetical protein
VAANACARGGGGGGGGGAAVALEALVEPLQRPAGAEAAAGGLVRVLAAAGQACRGAVAAVQVRGGRGGRWRGVEGT